MLPIITLPPAVAVTKVIVRHFVSEAISKGIFKARYEVDQKITKGLVLTIINIALNVLLLLAAIYVIPLFFEKDVVIYTICSIYIGSIIYSLIILVMNIKTLFRIIVEYKLNLKSYIEDKIYDEAYLDADWKINEMNFFSRTLNSIFGESPSSIASKIANNTTSFIIKKVIIIVQVHPKLYFCLNISRQ